MEGNVTNGCSSGITGYWGQGFLKFGTKASAAAKDTVTATKAGIFDLTLRYAATSDISHVDLYVNSKKVKTLSLKKGSSYSDWKTVTEKVTLAEGDNAIEFRATSDLPCSLYLDCFTVDGDFGSAAPVLEPLNRKYIRNLTVLDTENVADWSITDSFGTGTTLFGDREFTAVSIPKNLSGAEAVCTACDSKLVLTDLATCTAGENLTMYVAMDTRVTGNLPAWLNGWKDTRTSIRTSNDVMLHLYKKNFRKGESITLGTNGGNGNSVNYIVLAAARAGKTAEFSDTRSFDATDVDGNGTLESADLQQMQAYLLGKIQKFSTSQTTVTGEAYMQNAQKQVVEFEDALLDAGDASLRLRQIIGNGIAAGEAKEMIVVFPDICASTIQDKCTGLDAQNGTMHIWHTVTGGDHGGKTIRPHMYNYIRAIFHAS